MVVLMPILYITSAFIGNDWCYIVPCLLLATLMVGIVLPLIEVCSITCSCMVPQRNSNTGQQEIILRAWRLPLFGLLSDLVPSGYLSAEMHLLKKTWSSKKKERAVLPLPLVLQSLRKGVEVKLNAPSLGRGVYQVDSLEIATCFPFAVAWWTRRIPLTQAANESNSITVLPPLVQMSGNFHSRLTATITRAGNSTQRWMQQNKSTTLKGLRPFTERDSLNQIHWSSSARTGKLLVREFEIESLPDFDLMLDLTLDWNDEQFNLACTSIYALAHYGHQMGFSPQLRFEPSIDWAPLSEALADIPAGLAGEELAAEMLARVNPLPPSMMKCYHEDMAEPKKKSEEILADVAASPRTVLSIVPLPDARSKKSTNLGLVELQPMNARSQGKSETVKGSKKKSENSAGLQISQTLGQLTSDGDLKRL